jgi:LysM repeat protein
LEISFILKMNKILLIFALLFFFQHINVVSGQSLDDYPVYIVQAGDTLTSIAQKFGISPQDIINSNNISNPDILPVGTRLIIPSLAGVSGTLITTTVAFGHNISGAGCSKPTCPYYILGFRTILA